MSLNYRDFDLSKFSSKRELTYENSTYGSFVRVNNFPIIMAFKGKNSIFDSELFVAY